VIYVTLAEISALVGLAIVTIHADSARISFHGSRCAGRH
jgi:hypothetical protein